MKPPRAYEQAQKLRAQLGTVDVAIQRRHVFPLMADEHGSSIGAQIDALLCDVAAEHEGVVKSVTLNLFDDQLDAVSDYYQGPHE
jgi:hypothetical protein